MKSRIVHAICLLIEKLLRWCISPYLRASLLRLLGANIGRNVRIYEVRFFNLAHGFKNLSVADDAHIGTDVLIDLCGKVIIKKGATISPRVVILTHSDPGSYQDSPLCAIYPPKIMPVEVGEYSWVGTAAIIICGVKIGNGAIVGSGSLVTDDVPDNTLACGSPARVVKEIVSGKTPRA